MSFDDQGRRRRSDVGSRHSSHLVSRLDIVPHPLDPGHVPGAPTNQGPLQTGVAKGFGQLGTDGHDQELAAADAAAVVAATTTTSTASNLQTAPSMLVRLMMSYLATETQTAAALFHQQ